MRAKKLFPELTFKRLWNKITGVENKFDKEVNEINKNLSNNVNCLVVYKSSIACTENTSVSLGAVSDLTKNVISKASDVKGIGVLNAVGSLKYDPSGSVKIRDNNNIYYYPGVTQSTDITFFILY